MRMQKLDLYSLKCFSRLRNKAQMFTSLADDHYHTRLAHSIEVEAIALNIAEELRRRYPKIKAYQRIDTGLLSEIALLHDIGHTPYGHVGERTINAICSGRAKLELLPDFESLGICVGFKHNVNSGILYKEALISSKEQITQRDCLIIDGIVKHSSLYYKGLRKLDYGFSYINAGLPESIDFHRSSPKSTEGIIVAYADEIAQLFSDYLDLFSGRFDVSGIQSSIPYRNLPHTNAKQHAKMAAERMVSLFADAAEYGLARKNIANSRFGEELFAFEKARKETISSNRSIISHDFLKERNVAILFQHYFGRPSDAPELLEDFKNRALRYDFPTSMREEIRSVGIRGFDAFLFNAVSRLQDGNCGSKERKRVELLMKVFIRSVAIHISKMTDGYADHKVKKIISSAP